MLRSVNIKVIAAIVALLAVLLIGKMHCIAVLYCIYRKKCDKRIYTVK